MNPILDTALGYAKLGIRIIPIKPGTKYPPINRWQSVASPHSNANG